MRNVTIKDVALAAGVSTATVSYVLNQSRFVSPELTERVRSAVSEIGYRPDGNARSLRSKRTGMIGLIVPDNANPFFAEIAKGVEDAGFEAGFGVILCNSNASLSRENEHIDLLLSRRVDGIIVAPTTAGLEHLDAILQRSVPLAVFYREPGVRDVDTFRNDNTRAGYMATRHLLELGHRQIACLLPNSPETPSGQRVQGYRKALAEWGLEPDPRLMLQGDNRIAGGDRAAQELMVHKAPFTAVFSSNDAMAIGALRALRSAGYQVPRDVSVAGIDDIILASYSEPPLTTVGQPKQQAGQLAAERLIERIEGRHTQGPRDFLLDLELIVRQSTTRAP